MDNLAIKYENFSMFYEKGIVTEYNAATCTIETPFGVLSARQAVSCLLEPAIGDTVLVTGDSFDDCYILAVLKRDKQTKSTLALQGDVLLNAKNGRLHLAADRGISMASGKKISLVSSELKVNTLHGEISIQRLLFTGGFWLGQVERIKVVTTLFESVIERLTQKIKRSYREIEDVDHLRAGKLDYIANTLLSLRGRFSMLTAKDDVKIDGERIHMG